MMSGEGRGSSKVGVGDLTVQAQYGLTRFQEGSWIPTTAFVLQETLPTGKYDRLGDRPADGLGAGTYSTNLALYSQYFFWMPNGRILRTRFDVSYSISGSAGVRDVSVYGTEEGFRGRARPGNVTVVNAAGEYSVTRNWVLAMDVVYEHDGSTHVYGSGFKCELGDGAYLESRASDRIQLQQQGRGHRRRQAHRRRAQCHGRGDPGRGHQHRDLTISCSRVFLAEVGRMVALQDGAGTVHLVVGAWMHRDGRAPLRTDRRTDPRGSCRSGRRWHESSWKPCASRILQARHRPGPIQPWR